MNIKVACLGVILSFPLIGSADVVFDLLSDSALYSILDDQASASVTNGGIIATLEASDGEMNRTASGFGINGVGSDDTDALNLDQYIDIHFDQAVTFKNLNVSSWGANSAAEVQLGISTFLNQGSVVGTGDTPYGFTVNFGETVRIFATGETSSINGFSVDSFTVQAIPEPAVISFFAAAGIAGLVAKRWFS